MATPAENELGPREQAMLEVWQRHLESEFQSTAPMPRSRR